MLVAETEALQREVLREGAGAIERIEISREVPDVPVVVDERVDLSLEGMGDFGLTSFRSCGPEFESFKESLPVDADRGRVGLPLAVILFDELGVPAVQRHALTLRTSRSSGDF